MCKHSARVPPSFATRTTTESGMSLLDIFSFLLQFGILQTKCEKHFSKRFSYAAPTHTYHVIIKITVLFETCLNTLENDTFYLIIEKISYTIFSKINGHFHINFKIKLANLSDISQPLGDKSRLRG